MAHERTQVLIVGGGPVGLASAMFLGRQGIRPIVVERRASVSHIPRATGVHSRTMELFRMAGLEPAVREVGMKFANLSNLDLDEFRAGRETPLAMYGAPSVAALNARSPLLEDHDIQYYDFTPCWPVWCGQDRYEPIMHADAVEHGADVRFGAELTGLTQDDDGVTATIRERAGEREYTIRADYLIGADGVRSPVREAVGIGNRSNGIADRFVSIIFWADVDLGDKPPFTFLTLFNREVPGLLLRIQQGRWMLGAIYDPERGQSPADFTPERAVELARLAVGDPELAVRIESISPWDAKHMVADRYRAGRVLLAGDAAHCHPPAGGFGVNTGIQDAHNLAWKLAWALNGWADPALVDTYEQERRPVGLATSEHAWWLFATRAQRMTEHQLPDEEELDVHSVADGYRYRSAAVLDDRSTGASSSDEALRPKLEFDGRPGSRAPHGWLRRDGAAVSTLDLFGDGFVLLAGEHDAGWVEAAAREAKRLDVPLRGLRLGPVGNLTDADGWAAATGIGDRGALLVRPDGFVAWRAEGEAAGNPDEVLGAVLAQVFGTA